MEEECGAFAADCVILSCCCQCLVLQVSLFVFLRIPRKLAQKMKKFVKRRCRRTLQSTMEDVKEEKVSFDEGSSRLNCLEQDIEGILQELSKNEEFFFGSFWRQEDSSDIVDSSSNITETIQIQVSISEDKKRKVTKTRL